MDNLSRTDVILSKCRFIPHNFHRDAWRNLWSSGPYGSLDSQQNGAALDVSPEMASHSCFYRKKYDCTRVQRFAAGANIICLTYADELSSVL